MAINISKSDIRWSYFSLFLFNGINIIILPFVLAYLSSTEVGLWYTFTAVSGLVVILDFGFMTTLSRNVTFIWAGANEIRTSGFNLEKSSGNETNYPLFVKLFKTTKIIYLLISLTILLVLSSLGTYYIYSISKEVLPIKTIMISWAFYSIAVFLNMRYAYWNAILKGIGAIKENQQLLIVTKLAQLVFTVLGLTLGYGLIGVSLGYLISIVINRILANKIFYSYQNNKMEIKPLMRDKIPRDEIINTIKKVWPNTYKQGLISISNYINLRSTPLLSSAFLSLNTTASLGLVLQIVTLITVVGNTLFNTYLPQFSSYRLKGNYHLLKKTFKKAIFINYFIILSAFAIFIIFSKAILGLIDSNVELPSLPILITIMIYIFLFNNHTLFATFIATSNILPHYKAFIYSSIIVLGSQFLLMKTYAPTLWLLILPVLIIQLMYNNWKWPITALKEMNSKVEGDSN